MSWHVGMGGFWLGHLAISDAGTFSRRHRWVFVGPCHLCVHGPPAFPFDSGFLTHTRFYTQTLFTHRRFLHTDTFDTQTHLHTEAFTHKHFYTNTFTHKHFYTQTLYTQTL